jgi:FAD/FMN-containing dehydrogenase/Fe-S oxidoreductase
MPRSLPILNNVEQCDDAHEAVLHAFSRQIKGEVRLRWHDRMLYATDASLYQVEPIAVVIPASVEEAAMAQRLCAQHGLATLPRGGGTSLAGQCTNRAVVIDFSPSCREVLSVDVEARRCRVEPGVTVDELNADLAAAGLFFAPDPATSRHANIGGCIGNNAAGARSILYGRTSENVVSIDACLADGERVCFSASEALRDERVRAISAGVARIVRTNAALIRERFPKTIRRNAGYNLDLILQQIEHMQWMTSGADGDVPDMVPNMVPDEVLGAMNLTPLLCGSEGTLAMTLGAELVLHPLPMSRGLAVVGFSSVDEAIDAVGSILETGPSAVELLDDMVIEVARANTEYRRYVDLLPSADGETPGAALYVEYFAMDDEAELTQKFARLERLVPKAAMRTHTDGQAMLDAWKLRKAGEPLLHGIPGRRKPVTFVEDNAVPTERLGAFVRAFRAIVERHGTRAAFWAHASVGVLHVRPLLDLHDEGDRQRMQEIAVEAADLARSMGGVMSGEHGDGRVRSPLLERFYGRELMAAFAEVKSIFDPQGLLNPGNIVSPGPIASITESTRIRPHGSDIENGGVGSVIGAEVETHFAFEDEHGFLGEAQACNGAGVCRKKTGGTMCPSYMATLDERHSTRGRGNALRLAISGQIEGASPWTDPETIATLDLCLSCKACKSECPSNVDIAKLKAQFTAQRWRVRGGAPLLARAIANVRGLSRVGSLTPRLAGVVANMGLSRVLMERFLGIDRRRSLPPNEKTLPKQLAGWANRRLPDDAPSVVLFGDCFSMYSEGGIGVAAVRVLNGLGYRVELANAGCCGRSAISMGMLDEAMDTIDATIRGMGSIAASSEPILFLEPSCLSAVQDEWLSLKLKTPRAAREQIAARSMLVEDFIAQRWDEHPREPKFAKPLSAVYFHGHCHQKALFSPDSGAAVLGRVCGERLRVIDSGCCGMAGAFGFTRDHFDLSMKIGELVLLPAVREARRDADAIIVASGTSCRHQIRDGTDERAMHVVELLDQLLAISRD